VGQQDNLPSPLARRGKGSSRGFTLVELLVVIGIIAILMALLSPVIYLAIVKAQETRILAEITSMDGAMKAFKERYGTYPPSDFSNMATNGPVGLFLQKAFPNCNVQAELTWITTYGGSLTPAQALVFWLQGFTPDVEHPLSALNAATPLVATPLFPFDQSRLVNSTATGVLQPRFAAYVPTSGQGAPYIYFASQSYAAGTTNGYNLAQGGTGVCRPYFLDTTGNGTGSVPLTYVNPSSFQIISAGLDGNYGVGNCSYPSGGTTYGPTTPAVNAYGSGDLDNLTNFPSGQNLGNSVPLNQ
jgi:prepilin-type N-terminal cleavage/methylation domain-containing protein